MQDNGFLGWTYNYQVIFTDVKTSLTDPRATLVVSIDFYVSGDGQLNVDVPCVGRRTIGPMWANNRLSGPSTLQIGVTPVYQSNGRVVFVPEVLDVNMGLFKVDCIILPLAPVALIGGPAAVASFLAHLFLEAVIASNLVVTLNGAFWQATSKQLWTLMDLAGVDVNAIFTHASKLAIAVSREPDSLLVGLHQSR